jgi:hypothetical protein
MIQPACSSATDEVSRAEDLKAWAGACMDAAQHCERNEAWLLLDIASALLFAGEEAVGDKEKHF